MDYLAVVYSDFMIRLTKHDRPSDETADTAAGYALGTLTPEERLEFEGHLASGCAICAEEVTRSAALIGALSGKSTVRVPVGPQQRLEAALDSPNHNANEDSAQPGILFNELGVVIKRTDEMTWRAGSLPGVWIKSLFVDADQESATALVRMEPGSSYPPHRHLGREEVFLLEGDFIVEGLTLKPGDYCNAQSMSVHRASRTEFGCLFILRSDQRNEFLAPSWVRSSNV